ncbi:MAG: HAD-IA family hydrolase [Sphingomonadales bacterium]|nr:HAD-IA family hydrolase [Sphingomonadales bacterium]MDE2567684.1 HAD-IA family hydrolase [Sphingomonadales bacterium]
MPNFPFDIVGFDLDGTLLDTSGDIGAALNHALTTAGRPAVPQADVPRLIGGGSGQLLRTVLGEGASEAEFVRLQDVLLEFYADNIARHTRLFPGGEAMLDALAAQGVTLAVATNKIEANAVRLFNELGLLDRFACVIGGDTLGLARAKPKPDMLHEMVARCGGGRAAFVGDTSYDVGAAKAAGMPVVAVTFGYHDHPPHELGADATIDHYDELIAVLASL